MMVPITVTMKHVPSGEVRTLEQDGWFMPDGSFDEYIWSEGNWSCDCNRALFFAGHEDDTRSCGDGEFCVLSIVLKETGALLYEEEEPARD